MIDVGFDRDAVSILEAIPQLVWVADHAGNVTYVNARWTDYTGLSFDELLGTGWLRAVEPQHQQSIAAAWAADVARRVPVSEHRLQYRRFDGTSSWFLWRAIPVVSDNGSSQRWIGTHTDIDEQVRLEQDLSASERRYRSIIETTQEGVCIVGPDERLRYVNRHFANMLGYEPDELYGVPAYALFRESDRGMVVEQLAKRKAGEVATREDCFVRRDGAHVWAITAATPMFDENGAFAGSLGMITDITARKAMEGRLERAAAEYQSLAEAAPQIVWTAEPDGAFDYVNARWVEYTGISRAHARNWGWIPAVHRDDTAALLVAWRTALDTGSDFEASVRLLHAPTSAFRWHVMRARSLRDGDGRIVRWFGTLTDIHNERRTARQLEVIARTSTALAESLDRDALLGRLATLICREFAQFVLIALRNDNGQPIVVGSDHRDPAAAAALRDLHGRPLPFIETQAAACGKLGPGMTCTGAIDPEAIGALLPSDAGDAFVRAGAGPFVCAPLQTRGRTIGAIVAFSPPQRPLSDDDDAILSEIATRAAVAVENAELYEREHRVSATLQQALLPTGLPTIPGVAFDAIYEPGATEAQIGGDWYDAVELPDGRIIVSIGDVTGRGLRAAVIMGRVRQAIEALATYQSDPAQLLNAADAVLRRTHPDAIVTALVGLIDLNRRTFAYATAGHPTPIVRGRDGSIVTLPGSGLPLGLRDAHQPPTSTIVLPSNALLLLYTDGLVESTRDIDTGERRVMEALGDETIVNARHPAAALKARVLFDGSSDDVAVFTVRIGDLSARGREERADSPLRSAWSMHWSFDARDARTTRDVRDLYIAYLRAKGRADADYAAAELVFGELIGNVARHAPGAVDIEVEWRGDAPVLHVLDRGPGYDRKEKLPAWSSEAGRGLYLVGTLTREFTVTRLPGYGSHARAVLAIDRIG